MLTLYAAADEQQEIDQGLKIFTSEMPALEERYQHLLQLLSANKGNKVEALVQGKLPGLTKALEQDFTDVTANNVHQTPSFLRMANCFNPSYHKNLSNCQKVK